MTAEELKDLTGEALDQAGAGMHLDRVSIAHGHAFDESDDSYRRRLTASLVGAVEAGAVSQPAEILDAPAGKKAKALKQDGPTVEEWVEAGYDAAAYPPKGYAAKSSDAEIEAAIAKQKAAKSHVSEDLAASDGTPAVDAGGSEAKLP